MIPDTIQPLLRKTNTFNGTIIDITRTNKVKKDRITPKSSPHKRYFEYTLTNIRMNGSDDVIIKRITIQWLKCDLPIKLSNNNRIEFKGKIMPYIKKVNSNSEEVSYRMTGCKLIGLFLLVK